MNLNDSKAPEHETFVALKNFVKYVQPQGMSTLKDGYALSPRLCDSHRPLILKCLYDLIKGTGPYLKEQGTGSIPSKYRLFYSSEEFDLQWDHLIERNLNGVETGSSSGQTIGNKFLQSEVGGALIGAVTQRIIGVGTHQQDASAVCELFFWQNYDDLFERYLHDMVKFESPDPGSEPEFRIIGNYATHYFNTGHFKNGPFRISSYMNPILQELSGEIMQWSDNTFLDKDVKSVLSGKRVGSGSGAGAGATLAERLEKKWKIRRAKYEENHDPAAVKQLLKASQEPPDWGDSVYTTM